VEPTADPTPAKHPSPLRDANDLPVLGTLLAARQGSGTTYLVTGDKDLLALADQHPIITPALFWQLHGGL
jgi:uncharacterized protein